MQDAVTVQQPTAEIKQTRIKTKTVLKSSNATKKQTLIIARTCQDRQQH
jgi:hypothetical protein